MVFHSDLAVDSDDFAFFVNHERGAHDPHELAPKKGFLLPHAVGLGDRRQVR